MRNITNKLNQDIGAIQLKTLNTTMYQNYYGNTLSEVFKIIHPGIVVHYTVLEILEKLYKSEPE